jgi:hypothetical protein
MGLLSLHSSSSSCPWWLVAASREALDMRRASFAMVYAKAVILQLSQRVYSHSAGQSGSMPRNYHMALGKSYGIAPQPWLMGLPQERSDAPKTSCQVFVDEVLRGLFRVPCLKQLHVSGSNLLSECRLPRQSQCRHPQTPILSFSLSLSESLSAYRQTGS